MCNGFRSAKVIQIFYLAKYLALFFFVFVGGCASLLLDVQNQSFEVFSLGVVDIHGVVGWLCQLV